MTLVKLKGHSARAGECTGCGAFIAVAVLSDNGCLPLDHWLPRTIEGKTWVNDDLEHRCTWSGVKAT